MSQDEAASGAGLAELPSLAQYDDRGLVPVVVQDVRSGAVLMVAWANREALEATVATGWAHFYSRSRQELWRKGETSGNGLEVVSGQLDCDRDTVLLRVHPQGPTCHLGTRSCFEPNSARLELGWLFEVLESRRDASVESSYTAQLFAAGRERIAQKVGEEAVEAVIAAVSGDAEQQAKLVEEVADLIYHLQVLLVDTGLDPKTVGDVLARRHAGSKQFSGGDR